MCGEEDEKQVKKYDKFFFKNCWIWIWYYFLCGLRSDNQKSLTGKKPSTYLRFLLWGLNKHTQSTQQAGRQQGFSASARLTSGAGPSLVKGGPGQCRMLGSMPSYCLQLSPHQSWQPVKTHCSTVTIKRTVFKFLKHLTFERRSPHLTTSGRLNLMKT